MPQTSKLPRLWIFIHQSWCFCQRRRPTRLGIGELATFHPTKWTGNMVNIFGCTLTSCKTAESLDTKLWTLHHKNEEMIVCWYGYFPDVSFSQIQLDALLYDVKLLTSGHHLMGISWWDVCKTKVMFLHERSFRCLRYPNLSILPCANLRASISPCWRVSCHGAMMLKHQRLSFIFCFSDMPHNA